MGIMKSQLTVHVNSNSPFLWVAWLASSRKRPVPEPSSVRAFAKGKLTEWWEASYNFYSYSIQFPLNSFKTILCEESVWNRFLKPRSWEGVPSVVTKALALYRDSSWLCWNLSIHFLWTRTCWVTKWAPKQMRQQSWAHSLLDQGMGQSIDFIISWGLSSVQSLPGIIAIAEALRPRITPGRHYKLCWSNHPTSFSEQLTDSAGSGCKLTFVRRFYWVNWSHQHNDT